MGNDAELGMIVKELREATANIETIINATDWPMRAGASGPAAWRWCQARRRARRAPSA